MSAEMLVRHGAPTLAGLKTGNLFSCPYQKEHQIREDCRLFNRRLGKKGIRLLLLRCSKQRALLYLYRPRKLKQDLAQDCASRLLTGLGYHWRTPEHCLCQLTKKLQTDVDFPHEIGLFLGYPPEDVWGFIQNKADDCKCIGCWKVYGDEETARKRFIQYKKCTSVYCQQLEKGQSIERLTVTV